MDAADKRNEHICRIHYFINVFHGNSKGLGLIGHKRIPLLFAGQIACPHFLVQVHDFQDFRHDRPLHDRGNAVEHGIGYVSKPESGKSRLRHGPGDR